MRNLVSVCFSYTQRRGQFYGIMHSNKKQTHGIIVGETVGNIVGIMVGSRVGNSVVGIWVGSSL